MDEVEISLKGAADSLEILYQCLQINRPDKAASFACQTMRFIDEARLILSSKHETINRNISSELLEDH